MIRTFDPIIHEIQKGDHQLGSEPQNHRITTVQLVIGNGITGSFSYRKAKGQRIDKDPMDTD